MRIFIVSIVIPLANFVWGGGGDIVFTLSVGLSINPSVILRIYLNISEMQ